MPPATRVLLALIDQAYDRRSWHGTNLRGSLRGVSAAQAAWRPGARRHNIWEIAVHAAYWKYAVWRRITDAKRGSFELKGSNWFEKAGSDPVWRADLALLERTHRQLRAAVAGLSARALARKDRRSPFTVADLVAGAAAHDLYHAGQIQLLKRLAPRK